MYVSMLGALPLPVFDLVMQDWVTERLGLGDSALAFAPCVLDEAHVAFVCPAMDGFRYANTDVMVFMTMCRARGVLPQLAYKMFVRGLDWNGVMVPTPLYLDSGKTLQRVVDEWLRRT